MGRTPDAEEGLVQYSDLTGETGQKAPPGCGVGFAIAVFAVIYGVVLSGVSAILNCGFWGCGPYGKQVLPSPNTAMASQGFIALSTMALLALAVWRVFPRIPKVVLAVGALALAVPLYLFSMSALTLDWRGCPELGYVRGCPEREANETDSPAGSFVESIGEYRYVTPGEAIEGWAGIDGLETNICDPLDPSKGTCWEDGFDVTSMTPTYRMFDGVGERWLYFDIDRDEYGYFVNGEPVEG